ncbi:hexaprenyl-diphosphate synthase [Cryptococcus gattii E566]|uniref:(2E,6E)-farnesyl diphosphate synthase n=2 Tax=Cryptococcus gattii TaxID=37769 RepID=E6RAR2_CRYGW|nr:trans-hexaprenyltranstransferase, putative [Cryptococcus gattii WM276]ADV23897.1 trans-hexaprenyltranstransferase, putative [Cryptococcus gattii WM276]KIR81492.1 hexaprenyl-diphosphate synthase [Cryptococcus gattii EJB2]KIY35071.1 hexaprenyl-diphosphate synthase [Cryptococcus gattii E566]KJE00238.1 hexaprenyl-diphosphate synthase [Cryptococcus gattii NT-10]
MLRRSALSTRAFLKHPVSSALSFSLSQRRSLVPSSPIKRPESTWAAATTEAHRVLTPPPATSASTATSLDDPLSAINSEIGNLKSSLWRMLGSSNSTLDTVAKYYFQAEGKHLRPLLVLLMSQATNGLGGKGWDGAKLEAARRKVDDSLTAEGGVLNDWNPEVSGPEPSSGLGSMVFASPFRIPEAGASAIPEPEPLPSQFDGLLGGENGQPVILPTQRRLASITEMIHVASLLHDDVIDASSLRRGTPSAPSTFGNKLSILSGDFLLGRASVALARLGSREVVELLATVIANLVEGEVMQLRATSEPEKAPTTKGFEDYMRKTYLKTASLMAKSARAAVVLGGCGSVNEEGAWVKDVAYGYGRNLGIAFQLIDDALDFLPPDPSLGKPSLGADLRLGLATAPALFAWETQPSMGPLILRKFTEPGDVEAARDLVARSDGLQRTVELAREFAGEARRLVEMLPESGARDALVQLTVKVVERVK